MKAFTDILQSKKLAKILPLESADMFWLVSGNTPRVHVLTEPLSNYSQWESYPCWSLAALLDVLDRGASFKTPQGWACQVYIGPKAIISNFHNNPVDACYEIIIRLHELNLL